MLKEIIFALVVGFLLFEFMEHVVFPFVWSFYQSKKRSPCDVSSMTGEVGEVREWEDRDGKVFINGEIWNARSDTPLSKGDKAVIERVAGFVLTVKRVPSLTHPESNNSK